MSGWLALSGGGIACDKADSLPALDRGVFVAEIALPMESPAVLIDCETRAAGKAFAFALFYDARVGIVLLHRQGATVTRHILRGALPQTGIGRLTFRFDGVAGGWSMRLDRLDGTLPFVARGAGAPAFSAGAMAAIAAAPRHGALLWSGFARGTELPPDRVWIAPGAPVATPHGAMAVGRLRAGDIVLTDQGPLPLMAALPHRVPGRGSFAPVCLRAPFFGQQRDLVVSASQMVALSGAEIEYVFGEDEVLVPAGWLIDNRAAVADDRRGVIEAVALDFGRPVLIEADGCRLLAPATAGRLPARVLHRFEAVALRATMGRGTMARVA